jgi:hypothetical protein
LPGKCEIGENQFSNFDKSRKSTKQYSAAKKFAGILNAILSQKRCKSIDKSRQCRSMLKVRIYNEPQLIVSSKSHSNFNLLLIGAQVKFNFFS